MISSFSRPNNYFASLLASTALVDGDVIYSLQGTNGSIESELKAGMLRPKWGKNIRRRGIEYDMIDDDYGK